MPIIKSAKKRVRIASKATARNSKTKRSLKEAVKAFRTAVSTGNSVKATTSLNEAMSAIDIAAKKNVIHKNKAARKKAQLARDMKAAGIKVTGKKATPAKKITTVKKASPKKPVAKKSPAKKSTK